MSDSAGENSFSSSSSGSLFSDSSENGESCDGSPGISIDWNLFHSLLNVQRQLNAMEMKSKEAALILQEIAADYLITEANVDLQLRDLEFFYKEMKQPDDESNSKQEISNEELK